MLNRWNNKPGIEYKKLMPSYSHMSNEMKAILVLSEFTFSLYNVTQNRRQFYLLQFQFPNTFIIYSTLQNGLYSI